MSWVTADHLDWQSIHSTLGRNHGDSMPSLASARSARFSIVIEKSCADAIACGEDVSIPVPYRLNRIVNHTKTTDEAMYIHPVCLLAIHLAALTKPGGAWIVLSYSETRFDCLVGEDGGDEYFHKSKKVDMVPDLALLWIVVMKQEMVSQVDWMDGTVHRPKIAHWLYILRRTDHAVA